MDLAINVLQPLICYIMNDNDGDIAEDDGNDERRDENDDDEMNTIVLQTFHVI